MRGLLILLLVAIINNCTAQDILLSMKVVDKVTRSPLKDADVLVQDLASLREYTATTDDSGFASLTLSPSMHYRLDVNKNSVGSEKYIGYTNILLQKAITISKTITVELEKVKSSQSGMLPAMHFEYNKSSLSPENKNILNNLVKMFDGFPSMQIEIGLHADCREAKDLIAKRAEAIKAYISGKGKSQNVLIKEYNSDFPLNQCDCSNKMFSCPEEKYTENRRAEFKLIGF